MPQQLSQLNLIPLQPARATFSREDVERVLERTATGRVATEVGAISIESPVRRLRGEVFDFEAMRQVSAVARERGIGLHLDGARLFVAAAYSDVRRADYTALFDTVYVSLWKCFNSGSGAILAGPKATLADMYHVRRMFGGALWNAWPYAVVAAHYAEGYLERLTAAVRGTETLLTALASAAAGSKWPRAERHQRLPPEPAWGQPGPFSRAPARPRDLARRARRLGILAAGQRDRGRDRPPSSRPPFAPRPHPSAARRAPSKASNGRPDPLDARRPVSAALTGLPAAAN